jgi:hypothetical protein
VFAVLFPFRPSLFRPGSGDVEEAPVRLADDLAGRGLLDAGACLYSGAQLGPSWAKYSVSVDRERAEPLAAERRLVSILFSDLSGYTALSESADPEQVLELMAEVFRLAAKIVEAHGGQVDRLLGDAVLATFGWPIAHEMTRCGRCTPRSSFTQRLTDCGSRFASGVPSRCTVASTRVR